MMGFLYKDTTKPPKRRSFEMSDSVTNKDLYAAVDNTRKELTGKIDSLRVEVSNNYVTHNELNTRLGLMEKLVYGLAGVVLVAFATAAVNFFIRKN